MKKVVLWGVFIGYAAAVLFAPSGYSQQKSTEIAGTLTSEKLDSEGKDLDQQIVGLSKKIGDVVARYKLMTIKDIRILPYQVTYKLGDNYVEIEKHSFERNELQNKIVELRKKSIKIFMSGQSLSRIESVIFEKNYESNLTTEVRIVDPSPETPGTDDIVFTHTNNGKRLIDEKRFGDIKNTTAFPLRTELKRDFYIPHLSYFYSVVLNIAETYAKSIKDADSMMSEFLKKSIEY